MAKVIEAVAGLGLLALAAGVAAAADHRTTPFDVEFEAVGREKQVDPNLLRALARVESSFNPNAIHTNANGTSDFGLMQVNERTANALHVGRPQLLIPLTNIRAGADALRLNRLGLPPNATAAQVVAAYNVGPGAVRRGNPDTVYVQKVLRHWWLYTLGRMFGA